MREPVRADPRRVRDVARANPVMTLRPMSVAARTPNVTRRVPGSTPDSAPTTEAATVTAAVQTAASARPKAPDRTTAAAWLALVAADRT